MDSNIWFISDTHFNHDKNFIWEARGFQSVQEMNEAIVERWNSCIKPDDIIYHLGDVILGELEPGLEILKSLNGHIRLAIGNHDTESRLTAFKNLFEDIQMGYRIKGQKGSCLMLSHYPQLTNNTDHFYTYSIHGHTHSPNPFCEFPLMYNVNCEAHNCNPVALEDLLYDLKNHNQGQN